jgi:hypothetical protein
LCGGCQADAESQYCQWQNFGIHNSEFLMYEFVSRSNLIINSNTKLFANVKKG